MGIVRLNHAVLYVGDLQRSVDFYCDVLGFRRIEQMTPAGFKGAAFLQAPGSTNDHDLGLFEIGSGAGPSLAGRATVGLYHLAWEVDTLDELERLARVLADGRQPGRLLRPRHDEEPVRQGPGRHRVRGRVDHPGRPAHRRRARRAYLDPAARPGAREGEVRRRRPAAASASPCQLAGAGTRRRSLPASGSAGPAGSGRRSPAATSSSGPSAPSARVRAARARSSRRAGCRRRDRWRAP